MNTTLRDILLARGVAPSELHYYDMSRLSESSRRDPDVRRVLTEMGIPLDQLDHYYLDEYGRLKAKDPATIKTLMGAGGKTDRTPRDASGRVPGAAGHSRPDPAATFPAAAPIVDAEAFATGAAARSVASGFGDEQEEGPVGAGAQDDRPLYDFHGPEGTEDEPVEHEHGRYAAHTHAGDADHSDADLLDEAADAGAVDDSASGYYAASERWQPPQPGTAAYSDELAEAARQICADQLGPRVTLAELPWERAQPIWEAAQRSLAEE